MVNIFMILLLIGAIKCALGDQMTKFLFFLILDKAIARQFLKVVNND